MDEPSEIDCYRILGIAKTATVSDIRKAYRQRVLETHPDKNPGIETSLFLKVQSAWETLSDQTRRYRFDCKYEIIRNQWDKYEEATRWKTAGQIHTQCAASVYQKTGAVESETKSIYSEEGVRKILEKLKRMRDEADEIRRQEKERQAKEKQEEARKKEEEAKREEARRRTEEEMEFWNHDWFTFKTFEDVLDEMEQRMMGTEARTNSAQPPSSNSTYSILCYHWRWWLRIDGAGWCQYCGRYCSTYLLDCPGCDARACVSCKIRESGS
ncbi:hypothetical protein AJ79_03319 [Helicocarpus griseus UAMH5409]|uniref:J domain-containing protein n=1 Tax=Helicocarpus griseus UAMH5409 TaxID=1447875 RepID=A0A2B7XYQ3_9EURO|nr:hypothetical protein AJ79_03319 [Helicocarpus griseus UAMH5409]